MYRAIMEPSDQVEQASSINELGTNISTDLPVKMEETKLNTSAVEISSVEIEIEEIEPDFAHLKREEVIRCQL